MLGVWRTDVETGLYQNAYSVYEGLTYLPSVLAAVLSPRLSNLFVTDRRKHRLLALGGVGVASGLALVVGAVIFAMAAPPRRAAVRPGVRRRRPARSASSRQACRWSTPSGSSTRSRSR